MSIKLATGVCVCDMCGLELVGPRYSIALQPDGPGGMRFALPGDYCRGACQQRAEILWLSGYKSGRDCSAKTRRP